MEKKKKKNPSNVKILFKELSEKRDDQPVQAFGNLIGSSPQMHHNQPLIFCSNPSNK
jgi:hypothetical protein